MLSKFIVGKKILQIAAMTSCDVVPSRTSRSTNPNINHSTDLACTRGKPMKTEDQLKSQTQECGICYDPTIRSGDFAKLTECNHVFCAGCVSQIIATAANGGAVHAVCPMCSRPIGDIEIEKYGGKSMRAKFRQNSGENTGVRYLCRRRVLI